MDIDKTTRTRKCKYPFKLRERPLKNGYRWVVKVLCGFHNHDVAKTFVGHPYIGRLTTNEKTILVDMARSMVKPKNVLLTLKEYNEKMGQTSNRYIMQELHIIDLKEVPKQKMEHLMNLLEHEKYIHWLRMNDYEVVREIF